jgi:hypothetical protein
MNTNSEGEMRTKTGKRNTNLRCEVDGEVGTSKRYSPVKRASKERREA